MPKARWLKDLETENGRLKTSLAQLFRKRRDRGSAAKNRRRTGASCAAWALQLFWQHVPQHDIVQAQIDHPLLELAVLFLKLA
ncbi:hypothetical protein DGM98_00515 [Xanthomonas citri]|uniref:Transposase n=1 Tax=Xanthomonas citri pv. phaseoli var. fuscans TaxID=473423 RepID=A0AB33F7H5_XANCI|nr:hypothetical protein DGM98_00515 [Xanthomonas citri]